MTERQSGIKSERTSTSYVLRNLPPSLRIYQKRLEAEHVCCRTCAEAMWQCHQQMTNQPQELTCYCMIQHRITYRNSQINPEENIIVNFCDGNPEDSNEIVAEMQTVVNELKSENAPQEPSKTSEPDVSEIDADELLGKMSDFFDPSELEEIQKEMNSEA